MDRPENPPGWQTIRVEVATNGEELILIGDPPDEDVDSDGSIHDCDSMGCRWEHVIARFDMTSDQRAAVRHLLPAIVEAPARTLSLRESIIARLNLTPYAPLTED